MQIIFPKLSTVAYVARIIQNCVDAQKSKGQLTFDFAGTTWMDPFAITVISGTIQCCLQAKKKEVTYVPPEDKKLRDYLSQIGFNTFFHLNGKEIHKDTSVELAQLTALKPLYIENLIILIDSKMRLSQGVKDSLKMSMQEILTNVFDHSKSENGCFVCAQYYPAKRTIRLCITDFGVGILSTLKKKYEITTDIDAIKLSVKEGVTSRPQSAGFGLTNIRNFLKVNEGTLTIISGKGKVNFYSNKVESYNISKGFEGTIVNLKINANKESFYFLTGEEEYIF
jgi:anti-sigma regulatory factor (Ser/Thr protein kinase)